MMKTPVAIPRIKKNTKNAAHMHQLKRSTIDAWVPPAKHWLRSANPKIPAANPMMNTISLVFRNAARSTHTETRTR